MLVIDNAERLADSEAVLREVLFSAQQWADRGLVRTVFVTSDDALITRLLSALCWLGLGHVPVSPCCHPGTNLAARGQ